MKTRIGELAYESYGAGQPVVLLHAFPLDGRMWQATAQGLAGRCRVLAPDMRGFGASDLGKGDHSIADMADDVAALLDHLSIERATVGGLSMGGYVALAFAARHRARLQSLILADTRAAADSEAVRAARAGALDLVAKEGVAAMVERQLSALLSPTASEEVKTLVRSLGKQTPQAVCAGIKALRDRPDRRGELATLDCPTLVLVGAQDQLSPPSEVAEMAKAIPGARLVEIPHAGHLSSLENPEAFIHAISIFV